MESSIFTNECFLIFLSLFYWIFASQEEQINKFVSVRDILKMDLTPSTAVYMERFLKPGLVGVELFWSAVSVAHVVFNIILLFAIAIGYGPFRLLLYPSLVYLELATNAVLLLGRTMACHASSADPRNLACVIYSSTKIIGLAVVMYRWLSILCLWRKRRSSRKKATRVQKASFIIERIREDRRKNIEKIVRRRLTQTLATESMVRAQISLISRNKTMSRGDGDRKIWHRSPSQSSLVDVLVAKDWSREIKGDWKERRALELYAPNFGLDDCPPDESSEEYRQLESERKILRAVCRVVCLAMAPESVVHSWLQNLPINPAKAQAFYDDWKYLIADAMKSCVDSGSNDIYDDYNMLDMLCRKGMEYRGGPRISQSLTVLEDEDFSFETSKEEDVLKGESITQKAAKLLGLTNIGGNKYSSKPSGKIMTVESEMFATLTDRVLRESMDLRAATKTFRAMNDKSVQVNTLSDEFIQNYTKMQKEKRLANINIIRASGANNVVLRVNIRFT